MVKCVKGQMDKQLENVRSKRGNTWPRGAISPEGLSDLGFRTARDWRGVRSRGRERHSGLPAGQMPGSRAAGQS